MSYTRNYNLRYVTGIPYNYLESFFNKRFYNMPYQRVIGPLNYDESIRPSQRNEIIVANIDTNLYEDVLFFFFSEEGPIYEFRLMVNAIGRSRGLCCITYNNRQSAENALRKFNRIKINGVRIAAYGSLQAYNLSHCILYRRIQNGHLVVININFNIGQTYFTFSADYLEWITSQADPILRNHNAQYPGWGYMPFRVAIRHLEILNDKKLRTIAFQRIFGPKDYDEEERPSHRNEIFIGNIDETLFEDILFPMFTLSGLIYEMRLMVTEHGRNRGFCFVRYYNRQSADIAIRRFDGFRLKNNILCVYKLMECNSYNYADQHSNNSQNENSGTTENDAANQSESNVESEDDDTTTTTEELSHHYERLETIETNNLVWREIYDRQNMSSTDTDSSNDDSGHSNLNN